LRSRPSVPRSLKRVYSAQTFDDHTIYPPKSPSDSEASEEDDNVRSDVDVEKQKTEELEEPVDEVRYGIRDERDEGVRPQLSLEKTKSKKNEDPDLVTWDGPEDPGNPKNWTVGHKWAATFVVSSFTFISPVSSSMVAPALEAMNRDLGITSEFESALVLSIVSFSMVFLESPC
jgi:hypothetical protein